MEKIYVSVNRKKCLVIKTFWVSGTFSAREQLWISIMNALVDHMFVKLITLELRIVILRTRDHVAVPVEILCRKYTAGGT